ncbi:hypothetical protein [Anaerotalea alkaliphila]|uniref:Uncharacterized protein n=1 Tax=Anaerotalea alkaliphila TaxID=2662126 RepID=A0A7X5HVP9_9FIRM|nr:hypothetical protein [Anaerotalea alkaliphila]NDL67538.1 hypothetical protein [Anaerotalea alkaliphila]
MKKEMISVLALALISTLSLIRGFLHYIKGGMPDALQTLLSVACIIFWLAASYYYGKAGRRKFLIFAIFFWLFGLTIISLNYYTEGFLLMGYMTYVVVWLPMYGISRYFRSISLMAEPMITTVIVLLPTIFAYLLGRGSGPAAKA